MAYAARNPPVFNENDDYDQWKKDVDLWCSVTDIEDVKQAVIIHLSLTGRARQASSELSGTELKSKTGVKNLMSRLDRVFLQDKNWKCFNVYMEFENYKREPDASIDVYLSEFDRRHHKLRECDVKLPEAILACRLLKSCNLSDMYFQLALSTTAEITLNSVRETLKKLFTDKGAKAIAAGSNTTSNNVEVVKSEAEEAFYSSGSSYRGGRGGRGYGRSGRYNHGSRGSRRGNPTDYSGNVSRCFTCGSEQHWARDCPKGYQRGRGNDRSGPNSSYHCESEETEMILVATKVCETDMRELSMETVGHAVLDSGCSQTVCGVEWLESFLDTLNDKEKEMVIYENSNSVFKFGDGKLWNSIKSAVLPVELAGKNVKIRTDVVEPNIPLLLSRNSMKKSSMMINFFEDTVVVFGQSLKLTTTTSGHYTIPLFHAPTNQRVHAVLMTHSKDDKAKTAKKLHRQFAHPTADKLKKLLIAAGRKDSELLRAVDEATSSCDTCVRYSRPHPRPVVSMPMASVFNETVSADLKAFNGSYFLVLVDMCTRYCVAGVIQNKMPATIINVFFCKVDNFVWCSKTVSN